MADHIPTLTRILNDYITNQVNAATEPLNTEIRGLREQLATKPTPAPEPTPEPTPEPVPGERVVKVSNRDELLTALTNTKAGDRIELGAANYGKVILKGLKDITIVGPREAIIDGAGKGYALHVDKCHKITLDAFTVRNAEKGVMLDETSDSKFLGLAVKDSGHEGFHFRNNSTGNQAIFVEIINTGSKKAGYGEGFYVGQAKSNWDASFSRTNGEPDRSDNNSIIGCSTKGTTTEAVDIKEGTTGTIVEDCDFDGSSITGANYGDSYMDVKGNAARIRNNTLRNPSPKVINGIETHVILAGWGDHNTIEGNTIEAPGQLVSIQVKSGTGGNNVARNNNTPANIGAN